MNKVCILILAIFFSNFISGREKETNVELIVQVSPYINETEQMLYVYQLNGNKYIIDDSVRIERGRDVYVVHANVPYETIVRLLFSKRGPLHMQLLANPNDVLEIEITEEDQKVGISQKRLLKGTPNHDAFVSFWETIHSISVKRRKAENELSIYGISPDEKHRLQAIVDSCDKADVDYERSIVKSSSSPAVVETALALINGEIPSEDYLNLVKAAYNRFPYYLPLKIRYNDEEWAPADENSAKARRLIRTVERTRIMQKPIELPKGDSLSIGQKFDLILVDSLGVKHQLSSYAGKYILIELWASWCMPCIQVMPNILHAQKRFADDFVCCAITIDKDANAWKRSIEREGLQVLHHYKGTDAKGEIYNELKRLIIKGTIPQNYLLDRDGKIIAINIYGEELIKKLEELTKK